MQCRMSGGWLASLVLVAGMASTEVARAGQEDMALAQGKQLYRKYCAACHGENGKGDGVVGTLLDPKATDLTQLAKKNGGKFPFYETMLAIDGRTPVGAQADPSLPGLPKAHGDSDHPVWGEVFSREELSKGTPLDLHLQSLGKVMLITEYLQSIQVK